mmetsp:Transcript_8469/g.17178  ORF Transcript_8469/g.17178 Transcript_8469/m.17178 type:complete len:379 (-) Transcript_8469:564-1700(-)|eukprot:CAMPEP_0184678206 /NCGR_PEP_ID=MMETSP0312-20130426/901_1 /TAXON_ID=31354 /ORGANISM="Compsopogon coeruleus, Strain SAG 36.94" /LENGTH=378 /DNA_ID=CAMNT_0027126739 /DNA_START=70 /DNA_END=1206 /DNA_ORIENTATION=-
MTSGLLEKQDPVLVLATLRFRTLVLGDQSTCQELRTVCENSKARSLVAQCITPRDPELEKRLAHAIAEEVKALDAKLEDARENLGENEIREALLAKATFLASVYEKDQAIEAYESTMEVTIGAGQKLDILFSLIRIGMAEMDFKFVRKHIEQAQDLVEKGGDWERRNRLKVYEGLFRMAMRDMKGASNLFLDSLATFSATELIPYRDFINYTVITSLVTVDRPTLCNRVANAPEVLASIVEEPKLLELLNAVVNCDYKSYMVALPDVLSSVRSDRYLREHVNYICRELRVVGYSQFLASYETVMMSAMGRAFGVSVEFLDRELSRFITAGRLNCKIDRVDGVVEATRPDSRNMLYTDTLKAGDALLNRVQKLSRVIDV